MTINYKSGFKKPFEIIYEKFCFILKEKGAQPSDINRTAMAKFFGISRGQMQAWQRGQWPEAEALATIATKLGLSYRWLLTGEGDPEGDDSHPVADPQAPQDAQEIAALQAEIARLNKEVEVLQKELIEEQRHSLRLMREALTLSKEREADKCGNGCAES